MVNYFDLSMAVGINLAFMVQVIDGTCGEMYLVCTISLLRLKLSELDVLYDVYFIKLIHSLHSLSSLSLFLWF